MGGYSCRSMLLSLLIGCAPPPPSSTLPSPASGARGAWTVQKLTASDAAGSSYFATAVDGAGDLNGDGYDDAVIGAQYIEAAYVYYGGASGLSTSAEERFSPLVAGFTGWFGADVAGVGDQDGDGYPDLVVSAPADSEDALVSGSLFLYSGGSAGLDTASPDRLFPSTASFQQYFGTRLSEAGDLNADGYTDLIVSAHGNSTTATYAGAAYVLYGSPTGPTAEQLLLASDGEIYDGYGFSVSGAGDLDGDGYDDVIVGANGADDVGSVYIYYGSVTGIVAASEVKLQASDGNASSYFGYAVSGAGDLNADGYDDVVIGNYPPGSEGAAYVFYGSATGIAVSSEVRLQASDGHPSNFFGMWVSDAGDFDLDGYDDLIVSAPYDSAGGSQSGAAYLYYGSATGIAVASEVKLTATTPSISGYFGWSAESAGDLNADGVPDLIIGAYGDSGVAASAGAAYIYYGTCTDDDSDTLCAIDDCDDTDPTIGDPLTFYADADGDGYGDPDSTAEACSAPSGYTADATDCDDTEAAANPGAAEVCDKLDNNCDGSIDEGVTETFYADADGDGFGDADSTVLGCTPPSGAVADATDCLDTDATVYPGAAEVADDGIDQDCSGADLTTPATDSGETDDTGLDPECRGMGWSCATGDATPGVGWLLLSVIFWRRKITR
jgi:hypothetical protein